MLSRFRSASRSIVPGSLKNLMGSCGRSSGLEANSAGRSFACQAARCTLRGHAVFHPQDPQAAGRRARRRTAETAPPLPSRTSHRARLPELMTSGESRVCHVAPAGRACRRHTGMHATTAGAIPVHTLSAPRSLRGIYRSPRHCSRHCARRRNLQVVSARDRGRGAPRQQAHGRCTCEWHCARR